MRKLQLAPHLHARRALRIRDRVPRDRAL